MRKLTISIAISYFCVARVWALFAAHLEAQSTYSFVPSDLKVPAKLEAEKFILRTLTVKDVVKDYDAAMTSVARLKKVFGRNTDWPTDLTFEQDLIDLGWHQREFQR